MARKKTKVIYEPGEGPRKKSTAVAKAGHAAPETEESAVDEQLVEAAVKEIRRRYDSAVEGMFEKGNQGMLEIGRYVLETFYENDPEKASARGRKPASLRALSEHRDMPLGKTQLNNTVRAAAQEKLLLDAGVKELKQLSVTHQIELLKAPEKQKAKLIKEAVSESLSVRGLQDRIAQISPRALPAAGGKDDGERTKIPRPLLTFNKLDIDRLTNTDRLATFKKAQLTRYRKVVEETMDRLKQVLKALNAAGAA